VSAGGVVFREVESGVEVLLCGTIANGLWGLPKGTPEAGEGLRATAMREVAEETGVQVEILEKIGSIQYWFTRIQDNTRCHKTVHHYLMSPVGGDPSLHDHEYDVVQWFTVDDAYASLTYENEVNMVRQAVAMITKSGGRKGGARAS
jgi:8-oxo-dGTP pyrophosphatase MutT (NUDIX family)